MSSHKLPKTRKKKAPPKERSPPELAQEPSAPASLTSQAGRDEDEDPVTAYNPEVNQALQEKCKKMDAFHKAVHSFHTRQNLPPLQKQGELLLRLFEMALAFRSPMFACPNIRRKMLASVRTNLGKSMREFSSHSNALLWVVKVALCRTRDFPCEERDGDGEDVSDTPYEQLPTYIQVILETVVLGGRRVEEEELVAWTIEGVPNLRDLALGPTNVPEQARRTKRERRTLQQAERKGQEEAVQAPRCGVPKQEPEMGSVNAFPRQAPDMDVIGDIKDESEGTETNYSDLGDCERLRSGAAFLTSQQSTELLEAEPTEPEIDQTEAGAPEPTTEEDGPQSAKLESETLIQVTETSPSSPEATNEASPSARALPAMLQWRVEEAWERDGVYGPTLARLAALTAKLKERRLAREQ